MIDLMLWRARIGCFSRKVGQSNHSGVSQKNGGEFKLGETTDCFVVASVLWMCFKFSMMYALGLGLLNLWTKEIPETDGFQNMSSATMLSGTDVLDVGQPEAGFLGQSDTETESLLHPPQILVLCCAINAMFSATRLLLSNDINLNPGPNSPVKNKEELATAGEIEQ